MQEPAQKTIGINGVWFNRLREWQAANGQPIATSTKEVTKAQSKWAKAQIDAIHEQFRNLNLIVRSESILNVQGKLEFRRVLYSKDGTQFGTLARDSADLLVDNSQIKLNFALCRDGNLRCLWEQI